MTKKSPLGEALFNQLSAMNRAQARVYASGGGDAEANRAAKIAAARHKPYVIDAIKRPSESV